ncbi:hypothetical protein HGA64_04045 [Candidatus Falkowbacteria bacterium]|nr:hypothetical protein [Candidatus Falkowbacteria bacterium]
MFHAPEQKVAYAELEYSPHDRFDGYLLVGSIHSHGSGMAHHSTGSKFSDYDDEVTFDGMHITIGNINSRVFSVSCSIMVNGKRFMLDPCKYLGGIKEVPIKVLTAIPLSGDGFVWNYTDPYWAPNSGLKNWYNLLPDLSNRPEDVQEGVAARMQGLSDRFSYWTATGRSLEDDKKEKGDMKKAVQRLGNPFDQRIPLFFSLDANDLLSVQVPRPVEWLQNVSKLRKFNIISYAKGGWRWVIDSI